MSQARIVTDSAADLAPEVVEELQIAVIPLRLQVGNEVLTDGPSLRTPDFHRQKLRGRVVPAVLTPSPRQFAEVFGELAKQTDDIVALHLASAFGRTVSAARAGRGEFLGRCSIQVLDSQLISRAMGLVVEEAARAAKAGASGVEIVRMVRGMIPHAYLAFYTEVLEPLRRHRLLNTTRDHEPVGVAPGVKPLLILEEGTVQPLQRLHNRGKAAERLVEFAADFARLRYLGVLHSGLGSNGADLVAQMRLAFPGQVVEDFIYGPVLATFLGLSALGVVALEA